MFLALYILTLIPFSIGAGNVPCNSVDNTTGIANKCKDVDGKPFCVNINAYTNLAPEWFCSECEHNCDCDLGQYCLKEPGKKRGDCAKMEESIIGRPCNNFDSQFLSDNPKLPTKGVDDNLLCGKAIFENATNQFVEYEWLGYCQRGSCVACTSWGPQIGSYTDFIVLQTEQQISLIGTHDPSLLLCPGYNCIAGKLQISTYATEPTYINQIDIPTGIDGSILFFVIVLTLTNFTICICQVRGSFSPRKYKKMSQRA